MSQQWRGTKGWVVTPRFQAFTLVELLVVIAVIAVLTALLAPVLSKSKLSAKRAECVNNLRQLGMAAQMYWDENDGKCFKWLYGDAGDGQTYWFGWLQSPYSAPEGQRAFDLSAGALFPYLYGSDVRLCPALDYSMSQFKLKANVVVYSYGYNRYLSPTANNLPPLSASKIKRPADTALFADAAQVNDFLEPASPDNPMLEEFYYVDNTANYPNGHFRHFRKANVVFCDGHVAPESFVPGSIDQKLPAMMVGRLRPEILPMP